VWLDHSELENVVTFVRRSDAVGPPPAPRPVPRPTPGGSTPSLGPYHGRTHLPSTGELILEVLLGLFFPWIR
jgi:hypothetical protein